MKISEMTKDELNFALAIEMMGWHLEAGLWKDKDGVVMCNAYAGEWNPAEDMNRAMECAETMWKMGYNVDVSIEYPFKEGGIIFWRAYVEWKNKWWESVNGIHTRALSEAILMAVRGAK
jgi:hypothetical protein